MTRTIGVVVEINGKYFVKDLQDHTHPIKKTIVNLSCAIEHVVEGYIEEGEFCITKLYDDTTQDFEVRKITRKRVAKKTKIQSKIKSDYKIKILLLGSKYQEKYISSFDTSNIEVTWLDAFEHGLGRVGVLSESNDLVFAFVNHVPHGVLEQIKSKEAILLNSDNLSVFKNMVNRYIMEL